MTPRSRGPAMIAALLLAAGLAAPAPGVSQPQESPPVPPPAQPPATAPSPPQPGAEPTLDELLGLDKPADAGTADAAKRNLERALSPGEAAEEFKQAVDLMGEAAERLEGRDAGIDTQRIQDDILRKLDKMIADARRQRSRSPSPSSASQAQQSQQQQQQQAQSQQAAQAAGGTGENRGDGPARTGEQLRPPIPGSSSAWGNLPPHVRDALMQGWADHFSSLYRSATEEYYKRLAEDRGRSTPPR